MLCAKSPVGESLKERCTAMFLRKIYLAGKKW